MLRNYFIAALRNLARNRLHATINVAGLALGFAAATFIYLYVRNELSYDRFLPNHDRTYLLSEHLRIPGQSLLATPTIQHEFATQIKLDFPAIEAVTRLCPDRRTLRHGQTEADENVYWADPNVFDLLPLHALAGDLKTALQSPEGVVLTRGMARRYFGRDDPIGEVLEITGTHPDDINRRYPMRVTAVLEDLPANTHLDLQIILSGRGAVSELRNLDADPNTAALPDLVYTYLRMAPGAPVAPLQQALPGFLERHDPVLAHYYHGSLELVRFDRIHLTPATEQSMRPRADVATLDTLSLVGALVLLVAGINFVNLMTARSARRAVEVAVRKAAGALRSQLIVQFIGESVLYAALSMILAITLVELLLPRFNAFVGRTIEFPYWRDPVLLAALLGVTSLFGVLAGVYPALVLSAFAPVTVLKRAMGAARGAGRLRQVLVTVQFAVLITLTIASLVIYEQVHYALNEALRVQKDQTVVIWTPCTGAFPQEVRRLQGVTAAACAWSAALSLRVNAHWGLRLPDGRPVLIDGISVDYGFFELYGLRPLAGRFFSRDHGGDSVTQDLMDALGRKASADPAAKPLGRLVLNQAAVRLAGFHSPEQAIGSQLFASGRPLEVIGVVPDFSLDTVRKTVPPMFYVVLPSSFDILNVKLSGHDVPRTLAAIDRLWAAAGNAKPINRFFLDQHMEEVYLDITRRSQLFGIFSALTVLIACLGLLGLAAFTAERRTKEIGVRKAMGADTGHIVRLLLWQFTKPVLWAAVIAWAAAAYLMTHWLRGFAYHIELQPWVFAATGAMAIGVALLTIGAHSMTLARAKPTKALRDE